MPACFSFCSVKFTGNSVGVAAIRQDQEAGALQICSLGAHGGHCWYTAHPYVSGFNWLRLLYCHTYAMLIASLHVFPPSKHAACPSTCSHMKPQYGVGMCQPPTIHCLLARQVCDVLEQDHVPNWPSLKPFSWPKYIFTSACPNETTNPNPTSCA